MTEHKNETPAEPAGEALDWKAAWYALNEDSRALRDALQELSRQIDFWREDSAKAWDTCEKRRQEAEELRAALAAAPAPQTETLAWAVVNEDGEIAWVCVDASRHIAEQVAKGEDGKVVRVAIRVVDDEGISG